MKINLKKVGFVFGLVLIMVLVGIVMLQNRETRELNNELNEIINNNLNNQNNIVQNNEDQSENNYNNGSQVSDVQEVIYEDKVVVNSVVDATDKISFMEDGVELVVEVVNGEVKIGNVTRKITGEQVVSITGYYYQPASVTHLYALTESKKVYVLTYDFLLGIKDREFKQIDVNNVDKMVIYDVNVYAADIGQVDERNRVYAVSSGKEIQIDTYAVRYDELN